MSLRKFPSEAYRPLFENSMDAVFLTIPDGRILAANPAACSMFRMEEKEICAAGREGILDTTDPAYPVLLKTRQREGKARGELIYKRKDGSTFIGDTSTVILDDGRSAFVIVRDISEKKEAERKLLEKESQLTFMAYHDALTQLPNRLLFIDRLEHALARGRRDRTPVTILFIDLDGFKKINDSYGHQMGDRVLIHVADSLQGIIREEDTLARFAGDEFTLIIENVLAQKNIAIVAEKILQAVSRPVVYEQQRAHLTASIGIGMFPDDAPNVQELLKTADEAMYRAKGRGGNTYCFFASSKSAA